ncbi:hypothetical protein VM95_33470 [Streptomyces rubellomurinus]|uniref:Uncharacterized protein n=1 Tax=Streptomyces rubellomurinus (strain ATCC 31215) TaxID=359131 RepID=A0A0F2T5C2_STRR3|nr:hypothetical protein VM95_33470 [Streptomyces rubellomurinus]
MSDRARRVRVGTVSQSRLAARGIGGNDVLGWGQGRACGGRPVVVVCAVWCRAAVRAGGVVRWQTRVRWMPVRCCRSSRSRQVGGARRWARRTVTCRAEVARIQAAVAAHSRPWALLQGPGGV